MGAGTWESHHAITTLCFRYAEAMDAADYDALAELFADADLSNEGFAGSIRGGAAITEPPQASGAASQPTLVVSSATGLAIGQQVIGTNVPANSFIVALNGTTVTLNQNIGGTVSAFSTAPSASLRMAERSSISRSPSLDTKKGSLRSRLPLLGFYLLRVTRRRRYLRAAWA